MLRCVCSKITDAIHGHTNKSISAHYGRDKDGMGYSLPVLLETISKARMDEVVIMETVAYLSS